MQLLSEVLRRERCCIVRLRYACPKPVLINNRFQQNEAELNKAFSYRVSAGVGFHPSHELFLERTTPWFEVNIPEAVCPEPILATDFIGKQRYQRNVEKEKEKRFAHGTSAVAGGLSASCCLCNSDDPPPPPSSAENTFALNLRVSYACPEPVLVK